ncbi:unnamed protein product [Rhizophagus irregularis]|nr:unnamed protein product [Rhizophagus irregularis]
MVPVPSQAITAAWFGFGLAQLKSSRAGLAHVEHYEGVNLWNLTMGYCSEWNFLPLRKNHVQLPTSARQDICRLKVQHHIVHIFHPSSFAFLSPISKLMIIVILPESELPATANRKGHDGANSLPCLESRPCTSSKLYT